MGIFSLRIMKEKLVLLVIVMLMMEKSFLWSKIMNQFDIKNKQKHQQKSMDIICIMKNMKMDIA